MKHIRKIITMFLSAALMASALCGTAFARSVSEIEAENEAKYADLRAIVDAKCFTSGSRGSPESTGIIGVPDIFDCLDDGYDKINDSVTWKLKDGVLLITGDGNMAGSIFSYTCYLEPFAKNENIKTIIVGPNVKIGYAVFNTLPNLDCLIVMSNSSITSSLIVKSTKLKTIIYGADMTDAPFGYEKEEVDSILTHQSSIYRMNSVQRLSPVYRDVDTVIAISSSYGNVSELAAKAKDALANAHLTDEARAMLPNQLGGTAGEAAKVDPLKGITYSGWAKENVTSAMDIGIVPKESLGMDYTKPITRKQFCILAVNLFETFTGEKLTYDFPRNSYPFNDTFDSSVLKMTSIGVINGYGNGTFGPNDLLTREQAAVILDRMAAALSKPLTAGETPFTDKSSSWAQNAIQSCYGSDIMQGTSATTFSPKASYTIEQSIATMYRIFEYVNKPAMTDPVDTSLPSPDEPPVSKITGEEMIYDSFYGWITQSEFDAIWNQQPPDMN